MLSWGRRTGYRAVSTRPPRRSTISGYTLLEVMLVLAIVAAIAGLTWPALMRPWSRSVVQQAAQEFAEKILKARLRAIEESRMYQLRWQSGAAKYELRAPHAGIEAAGDDRPLAGSSAADQSTELPFTDGSMRQPSVGPAASGRPPLSETSSDDSLGRFLGRAASPQYLDLSLSNDVRFHSPELVRQWASPQQSGLESTRGDSQQPDRRPDAATLRGSVGSEVSAQSGLDDSSTEQPGATPWSGSVWFYPDGSTSSGRWTLVSPDLQQVEVVLRGLTGTVRVKSVRKIELQTDARGESANNTARRGAPTDEGQQVAP